MSKHRSTDLSDSDAALVRETQGTSLSNDVAYRSFDTAAIRRDFPIFDRRLAGGERLVYLDSGASAQKPRQVIDKERECYETYYANAHRGVYEYGIRIDEELEGSREKIARFINASDPAEVIFTSGTTMSINLVASGWGRKFLKPGDEIVLNIAEHHANLVPWQQIAREKEATLKFLPLRSDGTLDAAAFEDVITERTRLVAVSGMSNVLGTIHPIAELARRVHERGGLILVDGAQSVPHRGVDVRNPEIDFLAFSGHKIYGPTGIGVLYGRRKLLEAMDPFLTGGGMIDDVLPERSTWAEIPAKFEAGTLPIAQAIALGAAIDYVQSFDAADRHRHEQALLTHAFARLNAIPGLQIFGPPADERGPIVSFTVERLHPHDLASLLDSRGVAVRASHHCTMPLHAWLQVNATTRASFGIYSTIEDIDALADAIEHARKKFRLV